MTRTTRYPQLNMIVVTVLLIVSLFVAANPVAHTFAEGQATPVVETQVPNPVTPEADTASTVEPMGEELGTGDSDLPESIAETPLNSDVEDDPEIENVRESETVTTPIASQSESVSLPRSVEPQSTGSSVSLSGCVMPQDPFLPGGSISFSCTLTKVGGFPFAGVSYTDPGKNFTVAVFSAPAGTSATSGRTQVFELPARNGTRSVQLTFVITAVATTPANTVFDITLQACDPSGNSVNSNCVATGNNFRVSKPTVAPAVTLAEGTDYTFECSDVVRESGEAWAPARSICTVTALRDATMRLDQIPWTLTNSAGWEATIADQTVSLGGGPIVPSDVTVSKTNPYSFTVSMTPVSCVANQSPMLTVGVQVTPTGQTTGTDTSAGVTLSPTFEAPAPETTAILIATPGTVRAPYSMTTDQDRSASFTARYTVSGCNAWSGSAQMSPFTPSSGAEVPSVPVLKSATAGATNIAGTGTTTVQPAELDTIATAPTQLIAGTPPGQQVVVEQAINLKYTVPANTTVGTYESTVTVNISTAP